MEYVRVFSRYIGDQTYQVFIQNINTPGDFVRIVSGYSLRHNPSPVNHIFSWDIISPLRAGSEPIFVGSFERDDLKTIKIWLAFDMCLRKPSRSIGHFDVKLPAYSSMPTTIGRETELTVTTRADELELKGYIEAIRLNVKDQIASLLVKYRHAIAHVSQEEMLRLVAEEWVPGQDYLEQLIKLDYQDDYNDGLTVKQAYETHDYRYSLYYEWFIKDYGLTEPTGVPPDRPFVIPGRHGPDQPPAEA